MNGTWTFSRKLVAGFALMLVAALAVALVSVLALREVVSRKDHVIDIAARRLVDTERLHALSFKKANEARAFLMTRDPKYLEVFRATRAELRSKIETLRREVETDDGRRLVQVVDDAEEVHHRSVDRVIAVAQGGKARIEEMGFLVERDVESSSSELKAVAGQQATGAKEQSTAMTEITTTITELLATSRQISESAQRVSAIASDTAAAARTGDEAVERSQEAVGGIRRQVELVVTHMLDLGKKSQQIGGVVEIINELAEQTNILAINATIEAAGAGEHGRRFAVVAEEIRKLADRVAGSTKDVRALVEEVRAAVNTTVMATEGGSKAVEAGARQ